MASLNGLHILFADDATYNMRPTIEALQIAGAKVTVATDGTEVLDYLRNHQNPPPDVLILDIMMAGGAEIELSDEGRTTGVEVYRRIQKLNIGIPIVVSTVVSDSAILSIFRLDPKVALVEKPYRFEELARQIGKVVIEREKR